MRLRLFSCFAALVSIIWFIAFGITGVCAEATGTTKTLTPAETRDLVGATIPAKYYSGSGYTDFTFSYAGTVQIQSVTSSPAPSFSAGDTVLYYVADLVSVDTSPQYITVDLQPQYSFFDTDMIYQFIGLSSNHSLSTPATSVYAPPSWRWHDTLTGDVIIENQSTYNSGANYAYFRTVVPLNSGSLQVDSTFVEASFSAQSTFSAYSYRACFYGNSLDSGKFFFFISCPTISSTSTMASGTIGTTGSSGGSGDVNVTVDVDLTETNGFLQTIANLLSGLLDGIKNLFIPTQQQLLDFRTSLDALFQEIFGPFWTAHSLSRNALSQLGTITAATSIRFPGITVDVGSGETFTLAAQDVPLNPAPANADMTFLLESLRLAIDIISTLLVINMLRNKVIYILNHNNVRGGD